MSAGVSISAALLPTPSTGGSNALDAERPEELPFGDRHVVLPGNDQWAVKDPVSGLCSLGEGTLYG
jgi:hypothetical protein